MRGIPRSQLSSRSSRVRRLKHRQFRDEIISSKRQTKTRSDGIIENGKISGLYQEDAPQFCNKWGQKVVEPVCTCGISMQCRSKQKLPRCFAPCRLDTDDILGRLSRVSSSEQWSRWNTTAVMSQWPTPHPSVGLPAGVFLRVNPPKNLAIKNGKNPPQT